MTLNELNKFARTHNIDFNKDILCINTINDNLVLNNLEQIAVKEIGEEDNLVFIPSSLAYNACTIRDFELCDTVNSVDLSEKTNVESAIEILMENGNLFFEDYKGKVSPITYCDTEDDKIIFKE